MATDLLQRPLRDLRISVTDRCNFRCRYCMPREVFGPDFGFVERTELLSFEEIARLVRSFARQGVRKVRLTGGEPLLRRGLADLVRQLAAINGIEDLALTTNGSLLRPLAAGLRAAGLTRVTVSLDSLDPGRFAAMADTKVPLTQVLDGIAAAQEAGFNPVKINTVVIRDANDDEVVDLAHFGREQGLIMRFIEYMDVGTTNGWRLADVVPAKDIVAALHATFPLDPVPPRYPGEVATRYRYRDGRGEVGVIGSVTQPFCSTCTRARLSAIGELYTCLFANAGVDLRGPLRTGASDDELAALIGGRWADRTDRYSEQRTASTAGIPKVEMFYIGG